MRESFRKGHLSPGENYDESLIFCAVVEYTPGLKPLWPSCLIPWKLHLLIYQMGETMLTKQTAPENL